MVLALLSAPLILGSLTAGALPEYEEENGAGVPAEVEPVYVEGTDPGIMAISDEIDPSDLGPTEVDPNIVITPFESMIFKVMQSHGSWIVIVGGTLSEQTPLPATIEVAVPAGSPVFWFGEVGGTGDPTQDPQFSRPYQWRTEGEFDIYTATMTRYRDMQIEYRLNHNPFSQGPDGPTISVEYTPWQDLDELRLAVALPAGGAVLARDVEFLGMGPNNEPAFARIIEGAQAGNLYSTEITYTVTGGGDATSDLSPAIVTFLAIALALGTAAIFWLFVRTKNRVDDDDFYDEDEEDESTDDEDDIDEDEDDE